MTTLLNALLDQLFRRVDNGLRVHIAALLEDARQEARQLRRRRGFCAHCGRRDCTGHDCAAIVAEAQRIRAMMREVDARRAAERAAAALAPWERYIAELAVHGKL